MADHHPAPPLGRVRLFLAREPILNSVPLSLVGRAIASARDREETFVETVTRAGEVVAVAIRTNFPKLAVAAPASAADGGELARRVHRRMPDLPCVIGRSAEARAFAVEWERLSGLRARPGMPQRLHALGDLVIPAGVPGTYRAAGPDDDQLYLDWFEAFSREALEAEDRVGESTDAAHRFRATARLLFWLDPDPVCMLGARESGEGIWRVGPVYTPPPHRRRGYAGALTAAISRELLDQGGTCCLFTDLRNPTSNHVYREVGYKPLADFEEYWLQPP